MIAKSVIVNRSFLALCGAVLMCTAQRVSAQVSEVEPYFAVITQDATPMRCGDMDRFYKVAELDAGRIVKVIGESRAWARAEYPTGMTAFVRADEGSAEGTAVVLTRASKLRAANLAGPSGSWKPLLNERLAEGARLDLIENVTGRDGSVFFRVATPPGANGYVQLSRLRKASEAEINAHLTAGGIAIGASIEAAPTGQATAEETTAAIVDANDDAADSVAEETVETAQASTDTEATDEINEGVAEIDPSAVALEQEPVGHPLMTYDELELAFKDVLAEDIEHAEIEELIAEFNRVLESIDDTEVNSALRDRLERRVSMLSLRADYQGSLRDLGEREAAISADRAELEERITRLRNESEFSFVGRLSASKIYDGRRMPLLFRLESVGESPRTLGYLRPDEDDDLSNKLGLLIGVIGSSSQDATSELLIIEPERVVVIDQPSPIEN